MEQFSIWQINKDLDIGEIIPVLGWRISMFSTVAGGMRGVDDISG